VADPKPVRVARLRHPQRRGAYLVILVASTAIAATSCWAMIALAR
jgi:hypothetical protein